MKKIKGATLYFYRGKVSAIGGNPPHPRLQAELLIKGKRWEIKFI